MLFRSVRLLSSTGYETCFISKSLTKPSPKGEMESTKVAGHFSIDSTTYYTITLPPKVYLHHSPVHRPTAQSFHPLPVQCFPFHLTTYHGRLHMVSPLPLLPLLSGDQFSSKPLDQIVPISSKGIYQVPGFCCKVVKKEMDNGNEKRDKVRKSKNVTRAFWATTIFFPFMSKPHP